MKFLTFALFFLLMFSSVSFGQSYWFGGMTRIPGLQEDGVSGAVNIGVQEFAQNITKFSQTNNASGATSSINSDSDNTLVGYSTFQVGVEGAWTNTFFDLEGGLDIGFSSFRSDIADIDEFFLGGNLRFGGVLKYAFNPNRDLLITPYLRSGISLEFLTNDLALPTTSYYYSPSTGYVPVYDYSNSYSYVYGTSLFNSFYNISIGSSLKWKNLKTGISLGKYLPMSGDLSDFYDSIPGLDEPSPLFLKFNLGYAFSESFNLDLGWRLEWYDQSISVTDDYLGTSYTDTLDLEWEGYAIDLTISNSF